MGFPSLILRTGGTAAAASLEIFPKPQITPPSPPPWLATLHWLLMQFSFLRIETAGKVIPVNNPECAHVCPFRSEGFRMTHQVLCITVLRI